MASIIPEKDGKIPFEKHTEHHIWIERKKEQDEKIEEVKSKVKTSVLIGIVLSVFSGMWAIAWYAIKVFIERGGQ